MRIRRLGFSLVEVIVAVVLIDVALLALVAGSAVLIRQTAEMRARTAAVRAAANRLQQLGAAACSSATGTATGALGIREQWSITVLAGTMRELHDTVTYAASTGRKSVVLHTRLPC